MVETVLKVTFAGPHVTFQDAGRPGWGRFGVPQSGAMDRLAFRAANAALGNPPDTAVIEISRGGLHLECLSGATGFALAGGGFLLEQANQRSGSWSLGIIRQGEKMIIRPGPWGSWCYLAFAGEIAMPDWLGSHATHGLSGLGGGGLATGSLLRISNAELRACLPRSIPCPVFARPRRVLRVTPGPQEGFFDTAAISAFYHGCWRSTAAVDRMGTRLSGPAIAPGASLDMASEPLSRGSVQVAGDGIATILMADHQTTGGYPRIATALDCDLDGFARTTPGQSLAFHPVSADEAITIARYQARARDRYLERLAARSLLALDSASC